MMSEQQEVHESFYVLAGRDSKLPYLPTVGFCNMGAVRRRR